MGKGRGVIPQYWLGVPKRSKDRVLGLLVVQDYDDPHRFSKTDLDLLLVMAEQAALGVERKRNEDALHRAKMAAEAASRAKSEFLANMSHEIRTPLTGIMGMAELIRSLGVSKEQERYLGMLAKSGDGLLRLLNDILDYSKVEAGKLELLEEDFIVRELLESVTSLVALQAGQKGLSLEIRIGDSVPQRVRGDEARLRQVLINLVGNAVKFTESGLVEVAVDMDPSTQGSQQGAALLFAVRDTGPGVPQEKQDAIFESFTQGDGTLARRYGGVGLGLAISSRLVTLMGGRMVLYSEPGSGSTFSFSVPFAAAEEQSEVRHPVSDRPAQQRGGKILLAEDNALNQLFMSKLLARRGYEVTTVNDGQEALDALEKSAFDCVLMDVQMPVLDGEEATRRIRRSGKPWDKIPVIALTAHAMKGDRARFIEAGMNEYLSKPLSMEALEEVLARVMGATGDGK